MDLSIRSLYDQIPFGIFVWRLMSNFFDNLDKKRNINT